jgi:hypothetical protein
MLWLSSMCSQECQKVQERGPRAGQHIYIYRRTPSNRAVSNSLGIFQGRQTRLSPSRQTLLPRLSLHRATTCPYAPLLKRSNSQRQTRPSRASLVSVAATDATQRLSHRAHPTDVSVASSTDATQCLTLIRTFMHC